ncbi:vanadium-dependent haloperoxidase [Aestuariivivens insulae]|uniref:vanadium-dependent haloperoxidase n=1 Tax=Aestuariivivens insulae TaxID=1621988 RepID=UPI001F59DBB9|nr:vanadium-dependent haloperoxidase [Aestuariivivens insulae]
MNKIVYIAMSMVLLVNACKPELKKEMVFHDSKEIRKVIEEMTDIMVHDVTNPPLAARFFSYSCLAGYEVVAKNNSRFKSMHGILNDFPEMDFVHPDGVYNYQLSALLAIIKTAKKLQPSGLQLEELENRIIDSCNVAGLSQEIVDNSRIYADRVSSEMLKYAKDDKYVEISNYPRYEPSKKPGSWYPTPPAFIAAIEPYFNKVRPFTLDSASQFKPKPPVPFSTDPKSHFYEMMMKNYNDVLTEESAAIASFWDCNPFAVDNIGHLMSAVKKISPGAHWLGIAGIACEKDGKGFDESMEIHAVVSVGLMDAFMSCWDEKYRSDRIRPETAIRNQIDPHWQPLLQTPPFPEYTSGHSVISAASAKILTHYFGDEFEFDDTTEVPYGLPVRSFASFEQASKEAAISRFYGGIHYMDAIENGVDQGKLVADWVLDKIYN